MDKKETFKQFWKLYPRKIAKLVAERSWKRLPKKDINAIFKVLHEHLIRWKYKEIQYIPHASTWLNQRRWEDELEPIPVKNTNPIYKNIENERKKFLKKIQTAEENMASDDERKKALGLKK